MKITYEKLILNPSEAISWGEIENMRMINDKLSLVLKNGEIIELSHLGPWTVDSAFRAYEKYLRDHPESMPRTRRKRAR